MMKLSFAVPVLLLALFCVVFADELSDRCIAIGQRSGCSGCVHGSFAGNCDWCVDPDDESGLALTSNLPVCLPKGKCAVLAGGGRVSAPPALCPVESSKQTVFKGLEQSKATTTIYDQSHYPHFCSLGYNFTSKMDETTLTFNYAIDRTLSGQSDRCFSQNNRRSTGLGIDRVGILANKCFGAQPKQLSLRMQACAEVIQTFRCTAACPAYGVSTDGYCMSGCNQIRQICQPWISNPNCPFAEIATILNLQCIDDELSTCEPPLRIPASEQWAYEYGLRKPYELPIDCAWNQWGAYSACSETCGTGGVQTRTRTIFTAAQNGGECPGDSSETISCAAPACTSGITTRVRSTNSNVRDLASLDLFLNPDVAGAANCRTCLYPLSGTGRFPGDPVYVRPYVNFGSAGQSCPAFGNLVSVGLVAPATQPLPGLRTGEASTNFEDYYMDFWATMTIPTTGTYTFGVFSDDGFRLSIVGPIGGASTTRTITYNTGRGPSDSRTAYSLPAGTYSIHLLYWEGGGNDCVMLYSCPGNVASGSFAGCRVVGDTANGGLAVVPAPADPIKLLPALPAITYACPRVAGMRVRAFYANNFAVDNFDKAENLIQGVSGYPQSKNATVIARVIDYSGTGRYGEYSGDLPFPGAVGGGGDNFAVDVTGVVVIPTSGLYTFGVNSDDGFAMYLDNGAFNFNFFAPRGPATSLATFFLTAGEHNFRVVFYENGGWEALELFAARGSFAAFDASAFRRVGDIPSGGLEAFTAPSSGPGVCA